MLDQQNFSSFVMGDWIAPSNPSRAVCSAITGQELGSVGGDLDLSGMRDYAKTYGGPGLRELNFHDRARMLKALALHLKLHRKALYQLSFETGATLADSKIDIDGGIATLLVYASKGRQEMPEDFILPDGELELLSRDGSFWANTSIRLCAGWRCKSMHLTSRFGACWKNLRQVCWPGCPV